MVACQHSWLISEAASNQTLPLPSQCSCFNLSLQLYTSSYTTVVSFLAYRPIEWASSPNSLITYQTLQFGITSKLKYKPLDTCKYQVVFTITEMQSCTHKQEKLDAVSSRRYSDMCWRRTVNVLHQYGSDSFDSILIQQRHLLHCVDRFNHERFCCSWTEHTTDLRYLSDFAINELAGIVVCVSWYSDQIRTQLSEGVLLRVVYNSNA